MFVLFVCNMFVVCTVCSQADIKMAPTHIREAYKTYWTLKTLALETNLVDVTVDESTQDVLDSNTTIISANISSGTNMIAHSNLEFCKAISDASLDNSLCERTVDNSSQEYTDEERFNSIKSLNALNSGESGKPLELDSKEQCPKQNKESVWGSHLSKKTNTKALDTVTQTHQYTAKLFAGSKFNKRNPRKSLCRKSSDVSKPIQTLNGSDLLTKRDVSISDCSQSSQSQFEKENLDNSNTSVLSDEDKASNLSQNLLTEESLVKFTCNKPVVTSQPTNIFQKALFITSDVKELTTRTFDRGWIERVSKQVSLEHKQKLIENESGIELNSKNKNNPEFLSIKLKQMGKVTDSDEDFVYDSDLESDEFSTIPNSSQMSGKRMLENIEAAEYIVSKKSKIDLTEKPKKEKCDYINGVNTSINDYFNEVKKTLDYSESKLSKVKKLATKLTEKEILKKKVESGKANENFVRINIKKKVYARGKKSMTFLKYKKQKWKAIKKTQNNGKNYSTQGVLTCFKCGDIGHISRRCLKG